MKPVNQVGPDDCLSACVASLTGLPLAAVPVWKQDTNILQQTAMQRWLSRFGWTILEVKVKRNRRAPWLLCSVDVPCILSLRLAPGIHHAVVGKIHRNGITIEHDPSPFGGTVNTSQIESVLLFVPAIGRTITADALAPAFRG